jgi:hypothetical protein
MLIRDIPFEAEAASGAPKTLERWSCFKAASLWKAGFPLPHGRGNPKNSIDRFWTLLLT